MKIGVDELELRCDESERSDEFIDNEVFILTRHFAPRSSFVAAHLPKLGPNRAVLANPVKKSLDIKLMGYCVPSAKILVA